MAKVGKVQANRRRLVDDLPSASDSVFAFTHSGSRCGRRVLLGLFAAGMRQHAPTDHNAKVIREGQMAALEDAVKSGEIKIVADPWVPDWQADAAMQLTDAALTKARNQVVAVVASNDVTAGGAIKALEKHGLAGKVFVSGQDANVDAVRRIVGGTQIMTVYKPLRPLARAAASTAVQMAKGEKVEGRRPSTTA